MDMVDENGADENRESADDALHDDALARASDRKYLEHLCDALFHAHQDEYDALSAMILTSFNALAKPLSDDQEFLKIHLPNMGQGAIELSDEAYDELRLSMIKKGASAGIAEAEYRYACHLYEAEQYDEAITLYKRSAGKGYAASQHCYGLDLFHGTGGLTANKKEGLKYLHLAAGRLYEYSIEFLIHFYKKDTSSEGKQKLELYQNMLSWSKND